MSGSGTLTIVTRGKTQVVAADTRNTAHHDQAEVHENLNFAYPIINPSFG